MEINADIIKLMESAVAEYWSMIRECKGVGRNADPIAKLMQDEYGGSATQYYTAVKRVLEKQAEDTYNDERYYSRFDDYDI